MVDLLTELDDVVVRYQGGGNAGHTVINEKGKFALHLLPSGIFRKDVINVLGNGVALDPENLWKEIQEVRSKGISITPDNLKISNERRSFFPGIGTWMNWRSSALRTNSTVRRSRVSRRFIPINIRRRLFLPENCCIRKN